MIKKMDDLEKACAVGLWEVKGIGSVTYGLLVKHFGSAKKAWEASEDKLKESGLAERLLISLIKAREEVDVVDRFEYLKRKNIGIHILGSDDYPKLLSNTRQPPSLIYCKGKMINLDERAVAIVGTRQPTAYGLSMTAEITRDLVSQGFTIVSGLALGVDAMAHKTALESGGRTIAVLGGGLNRVAPSSNSRLADEIVKIGCVMSVYPPEEEARPGYFVARNQYIAGMSLGVVVTEGAVGSGAKVTAEWAMKEGRPAMAVPGMVGSSMSVVPLELIKAGAKLVTSAKDVMEVFGVASKGVVGKEESRTNVAGNEPEFENKLQKSIWLILGRQRMEADELARELEVKADELAMTLTMMEMEGWVVRQGREWGRGG